MAAASRVTLAGLTRVWVRTTVAALAVVAALSVGGGFLVGIVLVPLMGYLVRGATIGWRLLFSALSAVLTLEVVGFATAQVGADIRMQWVAGVGAALFVATLIFRLGSLPRTPAETTDRDPSRT